jgi:geranylgeranyl transferase type-2 subunit beta
MTAHLRMNAVYWGLTALCIMKHKDALDAEETIEYVMSCWDDEAGAHVSPLSARVSESQQNY